MESASSLAPATTLLTLTKTLQLSRRFIATRPIQTHLTRRFFNYSLCNFSSITSNSVKNLTTAVVRPCRGRLQCVSSSAAAFGSGGGGIGGGSGGGGDGGGDGAVNGGEEKAKAVVDGSETSDDVIILDVGGMSCGGCAASVKRILESQPQVSSASVNLTTETAVVWPVSDAKSVPDWQKIVGTELAKHLTSCGFQSNLRGVVISTVGGFSGRLHFYHQAARAFGIVYCCAFPPVKERYSRGENFFEVFERKMEQKRTQLKESGRGLAISWALCAVCLCGHLSHFFGTKALWLHAFHSTGFHLSLSLFTLLGPGRQLIVDGLKSLIRGAPNMNTLVGLGALSSFGVSTLAALVPKLGWKAFFEEPIMLIAFVLLGKNLEQRAKIKAASDMTGLLSVLPSKARLLINSDEEELSSTVEVPCNSLSVGDQIIILPGDRVPADGIVRAGRSTIDESSFTGEPLPVTKLPGAKVAAGTINLNGILTVEVQRPGGETSMGDIVRLVEEAQSREAPVQRLADKVAGHFTYGVMAISAATFMFWNLFGAQILPATLNHGNTVSLALQLSCSVLVVACPCALGLATPTAVLVGTSLGATKGLLLRGGNILEKFSMVDTVVFDKTGTLTIGRPVVTKVMTHARDENIDSQLRLECDWSEVDILKLAAGVESNTIHPIGKAIVAAARAVNAPTVKVMDGTFVEEPGSGAVATIESNKVAVGSLDWVQRHGVKKNPFEELEEFKNQSVVYVGVNGSLAGLIYVEDQIREDAAHVVNTLSKQGIDVYLLSGDKKSSAEYVASAVGIPKDKVLYGVKPDEKKKFVSGLQKNNKIVAMIGDGINDTAALASSHVGVAMGDGAGAASEVSSIVLMGNRLSQLLDALELSRLTMKTVKQNLWWAFAYNIVGIPIAAGVLLPVSGTMLTPSIAGALMGLSSVGVTTNSLLLRLKFMSKHRKHGGETLKLETPKNSQVLERKDKSKHPYNATS